MCSSLFSQESRVLEIETANYLELEDWINRLELPYSESASKQNLQKLLYDYYQLSDLVTKKAEQEQISEEIMKISIDSAKILAYKKNESKQNVIRLIGNVELSYIDTDRRSFTIKADALSFDKDNGILFASGNVTIIREQENDKDEYIGELVVLETKSSEFIFFESSTQFVRENSAQEKVDFFLTGEEISTQSNGTLQLKNGKVSTIKEDPYFNLSSDTMYFLPDGDWFVSQAVLSIGRVPVFYIPFFYYPGRTFFFNPAFGYSETKGTYFNSTIYLLGDKIIQKKEKSSFSTLLNFSSQENSNFTFRDGLLTSPSSSESASELQQWANKTSSYTALYIDTYSMLGSFLGLQTELHDLGPLTLDFYGGIAYSPETDSTQFDGFRGFTQNSIEMKKSNYLLSFKLPWYSDPEVLEDFANRKNFFDIDDVTSAADFPTDYTYFPTFKWEVHGELVPKVSTISPYIKTIQLNPININIQWVLEDETDYRIEQIVLPEFTFLISGNLLSYYKNTKPESGFDEEIDDDFLMNRTKKLFQMGQSEIYDEQLEIISNDSTDLKVLSNPLYGDIAQYTTLASLDVSPKLSFSIDYYSKNSLSHSLELDDNEEILFNTLLYDQNSSITAKFTHSLFSLTEIIKPSVKLINHNILQDTYTYEDVLLNEEKYATNMKLDNVYTVQIPKWGITYSMQAQLYKYSFDSGIDDFIDNYFIFDDDHVTAHYVKTQIPVHLAELTSTLSCIIILPPKNFRVTTSINWNYFKFSGNIISESAEIDEKFQWLSLTANNHYNPAEWLKLSTRITLDPSDMDNSGLFNSLEFEPALQFFSESHDFKMSQSALLSGGEQGLISTATKISYKDYSLSFLTKKQSLMNSISPDSFVFFADDYTDSVYFWKNRIRVEAKYNAKISYDFSEPYSSYLQFRGGVEFSILDFLDCSISVVSENKALYKYFDTINPYPISIIEDFLYSFDFFNRNHRIMSNFNLKKINIELIHKMPDWNLYVDYNGDIVYDRTDAAWEWQTEFSIYVKWKAIPEFDLKAKVGNDITTDSYSLGIE